MSGSAIFVIEKWDAKRAAFVPTGNARRTYKAAAELAAILDKKLPDHTRQVAKYVRAAEQGSKKKGTK